MRVLLTGSSGYIGCVLAPMLQARGHEVVGLDTGYFRGSRFSGTLPELKVLNKDIRDVTVETALRHLADSGFSPTYLRASTAYGASPMLRFDLVINNLTAWGGSPAGVRGR
tara:strand:- start:13312 stop:13644 length:333 start_codon:yes stop_codon:yes gene_type:complete